MAIALAVSGRGLGRRTRGAEWRMMRMPLWWLKRGVSLGALPE